MEQSQPSQGYDSSPTKVIQLFYEKTFTSSAVAAIIDQVATLLDLVAQLGEHYLDRVGVTGSIPVQITILYKPESLGEIRRLFLFFRHSCNLLPYPCV